MEMWQELEVWLDATLLTNRWSDSGSSVRLRPIRNKPSPSTEVIIEGWNMSAVPGLWLLYRMLVLSD